MSERKLDPSAMIGPETRTDLRPPNEHLADASKMMPPTPPAVAGDVPFCQGCGHLAADKTACSVPGCPHFPAVAGDAVVDVDEQDLLTADIIARAPLTSGPHAMELLARAYRHLRLAPVRASEPTREGVVKSHLVDAVGRDACVDAAMDYINNAIEHEEECESHGSDVMGDRFDCNCGVGRGLKELERIARLATLPRPAASEPTREGMLALLDRYIAAYDNEAPCKDVLRDLRNDAVRASEPTREGWGHMDPQDAMETIVSVAALSDCHKVGCEAREKGPFWCDCGFGDAVVSLGNHLATLPRPRAEVTVTEAMVEAGVQAVEDADEDLELDVRVIVRAVLTRALAASTGGGA